MNGDVVNVEAFKKIKRPLDVVRQQFGDMQHHARDHVHPDINFTILSEDNGVCRFRQESRLLWMPLVDESVLRWETNGELVTEVVSGDNAGTRIVHAFQADGPDETTIRINIQIPVKGAKKLLKPLLRFIARKKVEKTLEEDRIDLEEHGYPASRPDA